MQNFLLFSFCFSLSLQETTIFNKNNLAEISKDETHLTLELKYILDHYLLS